MCFRQICFQKGVSLKRCVFKKACVQKGVSPKRRFSKQGVPPLGNMFAKMHAQSMLLQMCLHVKVRVSKKLSALPSSRKRGEGILRIRCVSSICLNRKLSPYNTGYLRKKRFLKMYTYISKFVLFDNQ